jgi:acyltransferase
MQHDLPPSRILTLDMARFYAMAMVFYGHFVERVMYLHNPAAALQYKFIYSFHMVAFFVLAGYVAKESDLQMPFKRFLKHRFLTRLLPFIFFTFLFMIPPAFVSGEFYGLPLPSLQGYLTGLEKTAFGLPLFCVPSWFLMMIFSVELVHYAAFRHLKTDAKILIGAALFYVAGYILNWQIQFLDPVKGRVVGWNYLFIHEAITMYAFYLVGIYLRHKGFFINKVPAKIGLPAVAAAFLLVLFTYQLNSGHFTFAPLNAVVIMLASHGHFLWFPFTAIVGSLLLLFLAGVTPAHKTILWMGRNTLLLMCLNGIFYHYVNPRAAVWITSAFSVGPWALTAIAIAVTMVSMALCMPLMVLFNRYVPDLVGKPHARGALQSRLAVTQES